MPAACDGPRRGLSARMDRGGGVDVALQDLQQAWRIFVNSTLVAESARVAKEAAVAAAAALRG